MACVGICVRPVLGSCTFTLPVKISAAENWSETKCDDNNCHNKIRDTILSDPRRILDNEVARTPEPEGFVFDHRDCSGIYNRDVVIKEDSSTYQATVWAREGTVTITMAKSSLSEWNVFWASAPRVEVLECSKDDVSGAICINGCPKINRCRGHVEGFISFQHSELDCPTGAAISKRDREQEICDLESPTESQNYWKCCISLSDGIGEECSGPHAKSEVSFCLAPPCDYNSACTLPYGCRVGDFVRVFEIKGTKDYSQQRWEAAAGDGCVPLFDEDMVGAGFTCGVGHEISNLWRVTRNCHLEHVSGYKISFWDTSSLFVENLGLAATDQWRMSRLPADENSWCLISGYSVGTVGVISSPSGICSVLLEDNTCVPSAGSYSLYRAVGFCRVVRVDGGDDTYDLYGTGLMMLATDYAVEDDSGSVGLAPDFPGG